MSLNTVEILGIPITSTSPDQVLRELTVFVAKPASSEKSSGRSSFGLTIFTPNPEFLVRAGEDSSFRKLLKEADINFPDGIGLVWASKILGTPIKERISGADIVEKLLEIGNGRLGWVIGIVGARRGVLSESQELVARLEVKYPHLQFINLDEPELKIKNLEFKIVMACHGMEKQEKWIWENAYGRPSSAKATAGTVKANVFMGIGGSLDFITGFAKRAPVWMQRIGLEWLWRGLQRPEHFKRIWKAVFVFGWLVIKEKLNIFFRLDSQ